MGKGNVVHWYFHKPQGSAHPWLRVRVCVCEGLSNGVTRKNRNGFWCRTYSFPGVIGQRHCDLENLIRLWMISGNV